MSTELDELELNRKPWKYGGYKVFAPWVASSNEFFHIRAFRTLNARIILAMQDQICQLEEQLDSLDERYSHTGAADINNGSLRGDLQDRTDLIWEIQKKLKQYNKFVLNHASLRSRPQVPQREVLNTENWLFWNHKGAIMPQEARYIKQREDLISVVPQHKSLLQRGLENSAKFHSSRLFRIRRRTTGVKQDPKGWDDYTVYTDNERVGQFVSAIVIFAGLVMLVAPLWVLEFVDGSVRRLGLITGFIVLFLVLVATVSEARPFESLAATAAYSAVLMVFLQIGTGTPI